MGKVAIVCDSTANIPQPLVDELELTIAPLVLIWDNQIYQDGVDIHPGEFYSRLANSKSMPSTSQVTPETYKKIFKKLLAEGKEILVLTISSGLSGTMDSAIQAKAEFPGKPIELVDSLSTSMALGFPALLAARAAKKGASLQECKLIAEKACTGTGVFFVVDTLDFLHRGGRIGGAAALVGNAFNLKPILTVTGGKIDSAAKVRTQKKAVEKMMDMVADRLAAAKSCRLSVLHANAPTQGDEIMSAFIQRFHPVETVFSEVSPVIGTHTGPGTVGVAFLIED
jgi:DegV family protein with EDD domain